MPWSWGVYTTLEIITLFIIYWSCFSSNKRSAMPPSFSPKNRAPSSPAPRWIALFVAIPTPSPSGAMRTNQAWSPGHCGKAGGENISGVAPPRWRQSVSMEPGWVSRLWPSNRPLPGTQA